MAYIRKRTTSRGARYDVRLEIGGRTISKTFARRRDAEQWASLMEADRFRGMAVDPGAGRVKLVAYIESWTDARQLAPRTVELYGYLTQRSISPSLGDMAIDRLTPDAVRRWHKDIATTQSPIQAAKAYRLLRAVLNTAVADGLIGQNPCRIPGAGQERSAERPAVTPDVVLELADAIAPRYRAFVLLAAFGGLRRGELLALRRDHIDLVAGTALVDRQAIFVRNQRMETAPKTEAGIRTVHLPAVVVEALAEQLDRYAQEGPDGFVFTGDKGGELSTASIYPAFDAAKKAVGLEGVTIHDLRHAAGTLAAWTGATTRELMARLGHASPRAALRYQHAATTRDKEIAQRLDLLLANTPRRPMARVLPFSRHERAMDSDEE